MFLNIAGRSISILGGGWLGYPLARMFDELGADVKLSTRSQQRLDTYQLANVSTYLIDIENINDDITDFLRSEVLVINITNKNIPAFAELIKHIESSGVQHVIFISSTSVYPENNKVITESDGVELEDHPLSQIEALIQQAKNFDSTIVRFSGLIGYDRHPGRFFRHGKTIKNAQAKVNLVHRDDCLNILCAIINDNVWQHSFNVSSDAHPNKQTFYTHAAKALGVEPAKCDMRAQPSYKIIDSTKVKTKLNYQFIYPDVMKMDLTKALC